MTPPMTLFAIGAPTSRTTETSKGTTITTHRYINRLKNAYGKTIDVTLIFQDGKLARIIETE